MKHLLKKKFDRINKTPNSDTSLLGVVIQALKQPLCKHKMPTEPTRKETEAAEKYHENWHYYYQCEKCGYEEIRTYNVIVPSEDAINLLYETLPNDLVQRYKAQDLYQKYGSYIYLDFKKELSVIYDNQGEGAAVRFIKNKFNL